MAPTGKSMSRGKVGGLRRRAFAPPGGIGKPSLRRLARRGGVKRMSGDVFKPAETAAIKALRTVLHDAITYTEHSSKKTVTATSVVHALKRNNYTLYGYV